MSLKKGFTFCFVFLCQNISAQYQPITNLKEVIAFDNSLKNTSPILSPKRFNDLILANNQSSLISISNQRTVVCFKKIDSKWFLLHHLEKLYRNRILLFGSKSFNPLNPMLV